MQVGDKAFVYGTLKMGHGANSLLQGRSKFLRDTTVPGRIYDLGAYPGLKDEEGTVKGELYEIQHPDLPNMLDSYEGCPYLYDRRKVTTADGDEAWAYFYNGECREERLVSSGEWGA